ALLECGHACTIADQEQVRAFPQAVLPQQRNIGFEQNLGSVRWPERPDESNDGAALQSELRAQGAAVQRGVVAGFVHAVGVHENLVGGYAALYQFVEHRFADDDDEIRGEEVDHFYASRERLVPQWTPP